MSSATSSRFMEHTEDPKEALLAKLGDISGLGVYHNLVVLAVYTRPPKTRGGIYLPDESRKEDEFQGKVGLVVKHGASAFKDDSNKWWNDDEAPPKLHDWVWIRPSESMPVTINGVLCRVVKDNLIYGPVDHPDRVW